MDNPSPNKQSLASRSEQSFSLKALFLLVTAVAALMSCIDFKEMEKIVERSQIFDPAGVFGALLGCAVIGMLIGLGIGLGQVRPLRSAAICCPTGAVVAVLILMTCVAPAPPVQACLAVMLPLGIAVLLRYRTK